MISIFQKFLRLLKSNLLISFLGAFVLGGVLSFIISEKRSDDKCVLNVSSNEVSTSEANSKIFIDLSGAVNKPGLYEIEMNSRVGDLLVLGSGVSEDASSVWVSKSLNLSKKLSDASKIYIPFEWEMYTPEGYEIYETNDDAGGSSSSDGTDNSNNSEDTNSSDENNDSEDNEGDQNDSSGKINVNTASSTDLDTLPGIGPANAEKIINNRPYDNLGDFESKSGLYKSTVEGIKDLISF